MKTAQQSPDFPDAFYRITVKGLYVHEGRILLTKDYSNPHAKEFEWELPGGGLDFGENFHNALRREVREEMGLNVQSIEEKPTYIWTTRHSAGRGMEWYWVCTISFRFDLEDLNFTPTDECREIKFFSKEDLQENLSDISSQVKPLAERFISKDFA